MKKSEVLFKVNLYGAETDWFIAEAQLKGIGLCFQRLLPDNWYTSKVGAG